MNRHEKIAWFNLAMFGLSVIVYFILFAFLSPKFPLKISLMVSSSAFSLCALMAFAPFLFRKNGTIIDEREVEETLFFFPDLDERDLTIQRKARFHGFGFFWGIYVLMLMGTWMWLRYFNPYGAAKYSVNITVDIDLLPLLVVGGFLIIILAHSISTIIQYRTEKNSDQLKEDRMSSSRSFVVFCLMFFTVLLVINSLLMTKAGFAAGALMLMMSSGIIQFIIWMMYKNPGRNFDKGDLLILKIAGWIVSIIFLVSYMTACIGTWVMYRDYSAGAVIIVPISLLSFGALIMFFTVFPFMKMYRRSGTDE